MGRILLIHGWVAWAGYGCYLLLTGHTTGPRWWALVLVALIVATATYIFFNGTEFSAKLKGRQ